MSASSKRRFTFWRRLSVAFFLLAGGWFLAWAGARLLIVNLPLERADAVVVLSGSKTLAERSSLAAQLFKEGRTARIILTNDNARGGWSSAEQRNPYFYENAVRQLNRLGVPESAIVVFPQPVSSTHDEAVVVRDLCEQHQLQSLIIVTSAYHSRRALRTFRRVFEGRGKTIGLRAVEPGWQTPAPATWWLRRRGWEMVAGEYLKLAYYALRW